MIKVSVFGISDSGGRRRAQIRRIALRALRAMQLEGEFEIIAGGSALMRRLNRTYRGRRTSTDVLAFSYPDGSPRGQIFLARRILNNPDELTRLLVHAIVHLGGYQHRTPAERRRMERKEKEILHESLHLRT